GFGLSVFFAVMAPPPAARIGRTIKRRAYAKSGARDSAAAVRPGYSQFAAVWRRAPSEPEGRTAGSHRRDRQPAAPPVGIGRGREQPCEVLIRVGPEIEVELGDCALDHAPGGLARV